MSADPQHTGGSCFLVTPYTMTIALFFCPNVPNYSLSLEEKQVLPLHMVLAVFGKLLTAVGAQSGAHPSLLTQWI